MFDRVNRNARNLLPQELRHARYNGWFINFVEEESDVDFWWDFKISTRGRDKRMKNVQFVSELIMIVLENKIVGFDQGYIDEVYAKYDEIEELQESGDFSLEDFTIRLNEIKEFILAADNHNGAITKYASGSNNNYYTLWAYIHLNNPQNPVDFANAYDTFMEKVSKVKEMQDAGEVIEDDVLNYSNNSKGAVTDLPQRRERLLALSNSI